MANLPSNNTAEGYKQTSLSVQRADGETFIQTDVCPQVGDAIMDLGCGSGELPAYLSVLILTRNEFSWLGNLIVASRIFLLS